MVDPVSDGGSEAQPVGWAFSYRELVLFSARGLMPKAFTAPVRADGSSGKGESAYLKACQAARSDVLLAGR